MAKAIIHLVAAMVIITLGPFLGYVFGSLFAWVFDDTWALIRLWLNMPLELSAGAIGGTLALVGSMLQLGLTRPQSN